MHVEIYKQKADALVAKGSLTDQDAADLDRLRVLLCVQRDDVARVARETAGKKYAAAVAAGRLLSPVGALVARARGGKVAPPPPSSRPSSSSSSSLSHSHRRHAAPSNPSEDPAALVGGRCSLFARKFKDDVRWRVGRGVVALAAEDELEAFPATS